MNKFKYLKLKCSVKRNLRKINKIICKNYDEFKGLRSIKFKPFEDWLDTSLSTIFQSGYARAAFVIREPEWDTVIAISQTGRWFELNKDRRFEATDNIPTDIKEYVLTRFMEIVDSLYEFVEDKVYISNYAKYNKYRKVDDDDLDTPKVVYVTNAFSIQMLNDKRSTVDIEPVESLPEGLANAIGHDDLAKILGFDGKNRVEIKLEKGDTVYVAQIMSGRLPEGCRALPDDVKIEYFRVTVTK